MLIPVMVATTPSYAHLAGTLLPRGFFLGLGLTYLMALALDRLAARWRLPGAVAILLLGLAIPSELVAGANPLGSLQLESLHLVSLALLIFYAGLRTDVRRIRGMTGAGLRLGSLGLLMTIALAGLALQWLAPLLPGGLPPSAAWLLVCCLAATDSGALDDLLVTLRHGVSGRLSHLLHFEAALSTLGALLCFGVLAGVLQVHGHSEHQALHAVLASQLPGQLGAVGLHLIAGVAAGTVVGGLAPRLIDALVLSEQQLLLVAVALAFVAFGFGQFLGGGGLIAVYVAGVYLSNGQYRINRFEQQDLARVMHPFNTAAEVTVLLLLGFLVKPASVLAVLPLGLLLAIVVPLARLAAVWTVVPAVAFPGRQRLILAGCGLRAAVSMALAVSMTEELPHLRGISAAAVEPLGETLLALMFVVVLTDLLLQSLLVQRLLGAATAGSDQPSAD